MKTLKILFLVFLTAGFLAACTGVETNVSTKNYLLTTGFEDGNLVFLGIGGDINGIINPTLQANPGETITVMLVNGGEGKHEFFIPDIKVKSKRVIEKGESVSVTFTVPNKEIELEYHDSVANHADIGMVGILRVSGAVIPKPPDEKSSSSNNESAVVQAAPQSQESNEGERIFKQKCASCHTIGGGNLVGPDLKGVTLLRDAAWLTTWIKEPDKVLASGDPIATQILADFNNIPMPNMALSDADVTAVMTYLQHMDGTSPAMAEPTQAAISPPESTAPDQPSNNTQQAPTLNGNSFYGERIFNGEISLQNGGIACIACHTVEGNGPIGGGSLGPNLTHVYSRYGPDGLAAALGSLPFPTMQGVYTDKPLSASEQADLLAFFASADQMSETPNQKYFWLVLGSGSVLTVVLFLGMIFFWPRQRISIAQRLRKYGKL